MSALRSVAHEFTHVSAALNSRGSAAVFAVFCAHAVSGHPAAALPTNVMKSRRFTNQCLPRFGLKE